MKSLFEQYREEMRGIEYCCYCLETKGEKWHCCKENHFVAFEHLDIEDQMAIVDEEIELNRK